MNESLRQAAIIFGESLAALAAKNRGVPVTDAFRREVAEEIKASCLSKDVTPVHVGVDYASGPDKSAEWSVDQNGKITISQ